MDVQQRSRRDHDNRIAATERPQPQYRVSLTLAVTDPLALWTAAAAHLYRAPDMTLDDVLDVIGPREDPAISECIAALAKPTALPGCLLDDFWIDALRGCPGRIEPGATIDYLPVAIEVSPRRARAKRRPAAHLTLALKPAHSSDAPRT